jgi:LacI family transcriptional regulator
MKYFIIKRSQGNLNGARPAMAVTIKDVATRAGVALGTVSRVINSFPDVNPRLRERVEKAIRELNYRPNARAQSFVRDASPIICYILSNRNFVHPIHSRILQGVEEYCEEAGFFVLYTKFQYTAGTESAELRLPRVLQSHGISDCVILAGTNYDNFVDAVEDLGVSHVLLGNNFITRKHQEPFDQVRFDEFRGAYEAAQYLIHLEHRHIWYIGDTALPWFKMRYEGYARAMTEHGLQPQAQTASLSDDAFTNGHASLEMILEKSLPMTALFAGNDDLAYGAWEGLRHHGLEVPKDVSLIGFGGQYGPLKIPRLTTVEVDSEEVGWQLAKMAVQKTKSPKQKLPEVVVPTSLAKHGSCRPIPPGKKNSARLTTISRSR